MAGKGLEWPIRQVTSRQGMARSGGAGVRVRCRQRCGKVTTEWSGKAR